MTLNHNYGCFSGVGGIAGNNVIYETTSLNILIMNQIIIHKFTFNPYFDGYFQEGNFYSKENKLLKKRSYNGCLCIVLNKKRYGLVKLRSFAKKVNSNINICPF